MDTNQLKSLHKDLFGTNLQNIRVFAAPGRVNMIGEHTDYNGGYVLPAAINLNIYTSVSYNNENKINLAATDLDFKVSCSIEEIEKYKDIKWGNYQLGVINELLKDGYSKIGLNLLFHDEVPHGAGLSSSAAIENATAISYISMHNSYFQINESPDMTYIAKIGQRAENNFIGVQCGIMDQFASSMSKKDYLLMLKCSDLSYMHIPFKLENINIVVGNTNKKRGLGDTKYNERRKECEYGLNILKGFFPNAESLSDISYEDFQTLKEKIQNEIIRKRLEHVFSENKRVLDSCELLHQRNINGFGKKMIESHESLRNNYEVTGIELDTMVEEALKCNGVIGSRMTGAGFGGCTVSLVRSQYVEEFIRKTGENYKKKIGLEPSFYVLETSDGVSEL